MMGGGGACATAVDCQLAGVCLALQCLCDPGWTGPHCSQLDIAPISSHSQPAVWNSERSARSSWGAGVVKGPDGMYHGYFAEMYKDCGLSSWLPGSSIIHAQSKSPAGPFEQVQDFPTPTGRSPLDLYSTNPHALLVNDTWLLFYNGRAWPDSDVTNCEPNRTGLAPWHGGGNCTSDTDCQGQSSSNHCEDEKCVCEHHWFGLHCTEHVETVNVAYAPSPKGPWKQLNRDGTPFWEPGTPGGGNASLGLSNPSAFALDNGTIVLAYSRAPHTGISVAPSWRGPYTRLSLPCNASHTETDSTQCVNGANFSLVGCGEDPFIYRDFRGTWRVVCHGANMPPNAVPGLPNGTVLETIGMAFSTDLVHWTPGPGPAATSLMMYADGTRRPFARIERPTLLLDDKGFPLGMYNGVQAPNASYSCHSDTDRGCHSWTSFLWTKHGAA